MRTQPLLATFLGWMLVLSPAVSASAAEMILTVKICEKIDKEKIRVLAEPTVATLTDRPFSLHAGGKVKGFDVGTRLSGELKSTGKGNILADLEIHISCVVPQDDPDTEVAKTDSLTICTVLRPGETKRIRCTDMRWCELTVESAAKAAIPHRQLPGRTSAR